MEFETSKNIPVVTSFDAMGLKEQLLRGIYQYGFEKPSAIQQRAIMPIINGRDVIAQAQSGTGKTSLIALTMCQVIDSTSSECVFHFHRLFLGEMGGDGICTDANVHIYSLYVYEGMEKHASMHACMHAS